MNLNELPLTTEALTDRGIAIKLIGIGGAGSNAVDRLKMENLERLQMAIIDTDYQVLNNSPVQEKILIGSSVTRGLSAGGDPDLGYEAVESDREKIAALVKDCDVVFLAVGMGGGTGSGAAPIIAEIASENDALVIAFATMPFSFEGGRRAKQAEDGLTALRRTCDAVIPLPNDMLLQQAAEGETALDSFARADEWIGRGVRSIWSMLYRPGLMNLDFASLRQAFHTRGGKTLFSIGSGAGENAVTETIESLKMCPLMHAPEFSRKADRILVNIIGGTDLTLPRVNEIMTAVGEIFGREPHIIMGAVIDESLQNRIEICVLGTTDIGIRGTKRPIARPSAGVSSGAMRGDRNIANTSATTATDANGSEPSVARVGALENSGEATAASDNPTTSVAKDQSAAPALPGLVATNARPAGALGKSKPDPKAKTDQDEFTFSSEEQRGAFGKTDRNLFEGQDLDVPTYLRKGIKITL